MNAQISLDAVGEIFFILSLVSLQKLANSKLPGILF